MSANPLVSAPRIPPSVDKALDRAVPTNGSQLAGLSERNGPVVDVEMEVDSPLTNGHKRKSRTSISKPSYKDESDSDGARPLVS